MNIDKIRRNKGAIATTVLRNYSHNYENQYSSAFPQAM